MRIHKEVLLIAGVGVLAALSLALLAFIPGIPLFPAAPYLKYDLMDVPMIIAGMTLGPLGGFLVLLIGCTVQSLAFGEGGVPGFVMHMIASGALVMISSLFYRKLRTTKGMALGLILGSLGMTLLMVPLNLIITVHWYGVPMEVVKAGLLPVTIPFNLIKAGLNSIITFVVVLGIRPAMQRMDAALQKR